MKPKEIGFLENGTGKHQSNIVWDSLSCAPTVTTLVKGGTQQIKVLIYEKSNMLSDTYKF